MELRILEEFDVFIWTLQNKEIYIESNKSYKTKRTALTAAKRWAKKLGLKIDNSHL